jgi:hypothetical protein
MPRIFIPNTTYFENLTVPDVTAMPITMMAWVYFTGADISNNDYCIMQIQDKDVADHYFRMGTGDADSIGGAGKFRGITDGGPGVTRGVVGATTVVENTWTHCTVIFTSTTSRQIYFNGVLDGTDTATAQTPANIDSISIGREGDSTPGDVWDGYIAAAAVFNRVVREDILYAIGALGVSPLAFNPIYYWPLAGSDSVEREVRRGYNMTQTGTSGVVQTEPPMRLWPQFRRHRRSFPAPAAAVTRPYYYRKMGMG